MMILSLHSRWTKCGIFFQRSQFVGIVRELLIHIPLQLLHYILATAGAYTDRRIEGYHHSWYSKHAIANILSKKLVSMRYRVSTETSTSGSK
jgi:hypothetical protein